VALEHRTSVRDSIEAGSPMLTPITPTYMAMTAAADMSPRDQLLLARRIAVNVPPEYYADLRELGHILARRADIFERAVPNSAGLDGATAGDYPPGHLPSPRGAACPTAKALSSYPPAPPHEPPEVCLRGAARAPLGAGALWPRLKRSIARLDDSWVGHAIGVICLFGFAYPRASRRHTMGPGSGSKSSRRRNDSADR